MGIFDFFKKRKTELSDEEKRHNKIWELWEEGKAKSPYSELMTYQSEVNNGGHDQYFSNIENTENLRKELEALNSVLPPRLSSALNSAFKAYLMSEKAENEEKAEQILSQADDVFFENEEEINRILEDYAASL